MGSTSTAITGDEVLDERRSPIRALTPEEIELVSGAFSYEELYASAFAGAVAGALGGFATGGLVGAGTGALIGAVGGSAGYLAYEAWIYCF